MKRALSFLESRDFELELRWLNKTELAAIDPEQDKIFINLELLAVETFLHEFYHARYPKLSEEEVEFLAKRKIQRAKVKDVRRLGKCILNYQYVK